MVTMRGEGSTIPGTGGNHAGMAKSQGYFPNVFGIAGNPFGSSFEIPGKKPSGQPALPGENKKMIEGVYGRPGPQPMPGTYPLGLPMAMNIFGAGNIAGLSEQGIPPGYINKIVS
jgi:hypothetical protein